MRFILILLCLSLISCGKSPLKKSSQAKQDVSRIFQSAEIKVHVYYEEGAEPYTDHLEALDIGLWDLFLSNMDALFAGRSVRISTPKKLSDMTKMKSKKKAKWSISEIMDLSKTHPISASKGSTQFQIFFVNGYSDQGENIIGFHINQSFVMAVFKNVIKNSSNGDVMVPKYVEQATLVHEMGHALGLVNNGLPMSFDHHDSKNKAHCSNPKCVMYYENEGSGNLINFVLKVKEDKSLIMFDAQCLQDAKNYRPN